MLQNLLNWADEHQAILWWTGAASVAVLVGTIFAVGVIITRLPADYFTDPDRRRDEWNARHPALRVTLRVLKNLFGTLFLLAGIAMLFLPGQGLLTIFIGLLLLDFPGKHRLEAWLVTKPAVRKPMNWIRRKNGKPPLELSSHAES